MDQKSGFETALNVGFHNFKLSTKICWVTIKLFYLVCMSNSYYINIDGHGGGVGGCTPPLSRKFARHPARKKQGGGAPRGAKHPGEKKFWPPGEAIFWDFWAKSPPGLLNKHPTEKNFSPPGGGAGEKIFGRRRRPENFFEVTPRCRPPPCPKTHAHLWCPSTD